MRIAILLQNISSLGGIEVVTLSLAKKLYDGGNIVSIISCRGQQKTTFFNYELFYLNAKRTVLSKQEIEKVNYFITKERIEKVIVQLNSPHKNCTVANIRLLRMIQKNCKVEIVIHNSPKSFISRYRYYKEPLVIFLFKYIKTKLLYSPRAKYFFHSVSKFCELVSLSLGNQSELKNFYKINSVIHHNPYEFIDFDIKFEKKHSIVFIGRLSEEKNVSFILDAWKNVTAKNDWSLEIIGDGPLFAKLKNSIKKERSVKLTGKKTHEQIIEVLKNSSVLLIASFNEGFPTVVTEAMNLGNAIVTVRFDGFSDELLISERTCLVSSYKTNDFAEKIQMLIHDERKVKNMQKNCYEQCLAYSKSLEGAE
ncbi:MAG: glycosyltransferase [Treponemataceae bacterium]|nr:glycosyltransferase [Treponemataceae bacterium]